MITVAEFLARDVTHNTVDPICRIGKVNDAKAWSVKGQDEPSQSGRIEPPMGHP